MINIVFEVKSRFNSRTCFTTISNIRQIASKYRNNVQIAIIERFVSDMPNDSCHPLLGWIREPAPKTNINCFINDKLISYYKEGYISKKVIKEIIDAIIKLN